jgi:PAS domain S-box-containing protein
VRKEQSQRVLIRAVVFGGAAALAAAWAATPPPLDAPTLRLAVMLTALTALAELVSIRLPHGATSEQISLGEVAIAANVALLPVAFAPTAAVAGLVVSLLIRRSAAVKVAYNGGQYAIATTAAAACFHGLGLGDPGTNAGLGALFLGMTAFAASNLLTISAIIATASGRRLRSVLRDEVALTLAIALGNSSLGIVAVALWLERPVLVPVILAPTLALHVAYRAWVRQRDYAQEVADQKAKLERIIEHSSEGIVLVDSGGTVALWSPSMTTITGVSADEAEGKAIGYLLRGRAPDGSSVSVGVGGQDGVIEVARADDGSGRFLRVRHGPARDPDGTLRWDVVVVDDVTREREVEKMKEHFLATVSHELRTPLTPIVGYAKFLLRHENVDEETRHEALVSLLQRAEHMQRLVEDLLLASTIGAGGAGMVMHARREPVDLAALTQRCVAAARVSYPERAIRFEGGGSPLVAVGDQLRISQVLANLIENAVKYSHPPSAILVRLDRRADVGVISVIDRGRGIPADQLEQIFSKFRRLEDPNRMETGGAGLGLYIVDQLVAAMGGRVEVTSRPGQGSTFSVSLPVLAGRAESGAGEHTQRSA